MSRFIHSRGRRVSRLAGFSLVEVLVSTMLIGLVLVAALRCLGAAIRAGTATSRRGQAVLLAEGLMAEVLQNRYLEPDDDPLWGREGSAENDGSRAAFDDVDDYDNWTASPPQAKSGAALPNMSGWRRQVVVTHVDPDNLASPLPDNDDRGVKAIQVAVSYNGEELARLYGIQTTAWLDMIPEPGNNRTTGSEPQGNQPPVAVAAGSPLSGVQVVTVNFNATASSDPEDGPLSYAWDFGDGSNGSGTTPSHTYTNGGQDPVTRTVTLTVTDAWGAQDTDSLTITIYGG